MLGFGIVAYVNIVYTMILAFFIFSVLLMPTMINYNYGTNYEGSTKAGYATGMLSNLGFS